MQVEQELPLHTVAPPKSTANPYRLGDSWVYVGLVIAVLVLFAPVLTRLIGQWYSDPDYSHGFFVPLFSAYLIWRKRNALKIAPQPSWWGTVLVAGSLGLLFLGSLGAELFLTRIAFVGTVIGLIVFVRGFHTLRAVAFPVAFLFFMIPLPTIIYNEIVFPLQLLASRFAGACLTGTHVVPVLREGNLLILPNATLEVVEACSGIRSLMTLIVLSLAYSYLVESSAWVRWILAFAMIPIAVIANGSRVMGTALITYFWGSKAAEGFVHSLAGISIFVIATALMLGLHSVLAFGRRRMKKKSPQERRQNV